MCIRDRAWIFGATMRRFIELLRSLVHIHNGFSWTEACHRDYSLVQFHSLYTYTIWVSYATYLSMLMTLHYPKLLLQALPNMQSLLNQFSTWADENNMQINCIKTKEMMLGSTSKRDWPLLTIHGTPLERVSVYKLLGFFISADLRWETHIEYIISKAASRLYFVKQLKRAGLSSSHLLHFYTTVIRPVLEYASPLWHPTLTKSQIDRLEAVQRRAIKVIFVTPHPLRILRPWAGRHLISSSKTTGSLQAFFSEIFVNLTTVYTISSHPRGT